MVGVRGQPRVPHLAHGRVALQKSGNALAVLVVARHAQAQCLEAALQQEQAVRIARGANDVVELAHLGHQVGAAHQGAAQQVVVPTQILGAVDHQSMPMGSGRRLQGAKVASTTARALLRQASCSRSIRIGWWRPVRSAACWADGLEGLHIVDRRHAVIPSRGMISCPNWRTSQQSSVMI